MIDSYTVVAGLFLVLLSLLYQFDSEYFHFLAAADSKGRAGLLDGRTRRNHRRYINYLASQKEIDCPALKSALYELILARDAFGVRDHYLLYLNSCLSDDDLRERMQDYFKVFLDEFGAGMDDETIRNTNMNRGLSEKEGSSESKVEERMRKVEEKVKLAEEKLRRVEERKEEARKISVMKKKSVVISDAIEYFHLSECE